MTWPKRIVLAVLLAVVATLAAAWLNPLPGEVPTPAGLLRNTAHYVTTADGTRIAIDVWLPADLAAGQRVPALVEGSRYWRATRVTLAGRLLELFGRAAPGTRPDGYTAFFNDAGYAYVTVDVRGTGASFGVHATEYSLQEMADYAAVLDWIVAQPWSSGRVGAVGVSYAGTTAELMTTTGHPALKAAAPLYSDFDAQYHLVTPGGIYQPAFVEAWSEVVLAMDRNDVCGVMGAETVLDCLLGRLMVDGVKPVDGHVDDLRRGVAEHDSQDPRQLVEVLEYRDSPWGDAGYSSLANQAYARKAGIEASGVPLYVVAGWFDAATVEGTLARFAGFANPQTVTIGPFSHGGRHDTDPFSPVDAPPVVSPREQLARLERFFAAHLKGEGEPPAPGIRYYVMGDGWRSTDRWPPAGIEREPLYLDAGGRLAGRPPMAEDITLYQVDFSTGTEAATRWMTQLGGSDVHYDDRDSARRGTVSFTSAAVDRARTLTGTVTLELWLASDERDGAIHAYLEAVAPDGRARYLTEGVLRLEHRQVSTATPVYPHFGPYHSFLEADAAPMAPGQRERIAMGLYATSARIPAGYRLRLVLAGADATSFARVPETGDPPGWLIHHGGDEPSRIVVPFES